MSPPKGIKLMPGHSWSTEYPGFIDCNNGRLRKPTVWRGKQVNHYYVVRPCTHCATTMLQSVRNAKMNNPYCSKACKAARMAAECLGRKYKKPRQHGEGHHIVVKLPEHPRASHQGLVFEHILVAEGMLGRPIERTERVHHINVIKSDNRPDNLFVCSSDTEHFLIHGSLNVCVAELIERGVLTFDREERKYRVVPQQPLAG